MSLSSELKVYCKGRVKMPLYIKPILIYFAVISLAAVVITVKDKRAAVKGKWRVPEATLMLVGLFGGAIAMLVTMKVIRHKTKHKSFMIGLPVIMILQASALLLLSHFTGFFEYAI